MTEYFYVASSGTSAIEIKVGAITGMRYYAPGYGRDMAETELDYDFWNCWAERSLTECFKIDREQFIRFIQTGEIPRRLPLP